MRIVQFVPNVVIIGQFNTGQQFAQCCSDVQLECHTQWIRFKLVHKLHTHIDAKANASIEHNKQQYDIRVINDILHFEQ
jgi:hypothetical protein